MTEDEKNKYIKSGLEDEKKGIKYGENSVFTTEQFVDETSGGVNASSF